MTDAANSPDNGDTTPQTREKELPPAAQRALKEAAERRAAAHKTADQASNGAKEVNGPKGEEPTRYGDWERNGRAVDF